MSVCNDLCGDTKIRIGICNIDDLYPGSGCEQRVKCKGGVEKLVPKTHASGHHSTHRKCTGEAFRIILHKPGRNQAAQRMTPGDGSTWLSDKGVEGVKDGDLIGQCLMNGPALRGVRGTGQRVTVRQEIETEKGVFASIRGRIGIVRKRVTVTVQKQSSVPVTRDLNQVGRSVRKCSVVSCNASDRLRARREAEQQQRRQRSKQGHRGSPGQSSGFHDFLTFCFSVLRVNISQPGPAPG